MIDLTKFKPDLIDNNPKDGTFTLEYIDSLIQKNGGLLRS